jgi:hypothetical protein
MRTAASRVEDPASQETRKGTPALHTVFASGIVVLTVLAALVLGILFGYVAVTAILRGFAAVRKPVQPAAAPQRVLVDATRSGA